MALSGSASPFDGLTVLSYIEGLTVLSKSKDKAEGRSCLRSLLPATFIALLRFSGLKYKRYRRYKRDKLKDW
jgi:hypothetical protein